MQAPDTSQVSVVQGFPSLHTLSGPGAQTLAAHLSPTVHGLPSVQLPVATSCKHLVFPQISLVHGFLSSQALPPPVHAPPMHDSPTVHGLPSSHAVAVPGRWLQPFCGSQRSRLHGWPSSQFSFDVPVHTPFLHASPDVQRSQSLHARLFGVKTQPLPTQASVVQALPSSQGMGVAMQLLSWQWSLVVQVELSSQGPLMGVCAQPFFLSQVSWVQGFLSSQLTAGPEH